MKKILIGLAIGLFVILAVVVAMTLYIPIDHAEHWEKRSLLNIQADAKALHAYREICGRFPTTLEGLAVLQQTFVCDGKRIDPVAKYQIRDAFNEPLIYESDGRTFKIGTLGKHEQTGRTGPATEFWMTSEDDVGQNKK